MDAIYARQSVDKADSLSIQGQIDLCRRTADSEVIVYQDRGYSGKNTQRPAFQSLMADVERGKIQKIVVYRLDRFSRSIADFGRLWEILSRHHVEFVSVNETFDTSTPMGRAMLNIIMVFAQLERETTAERVRDNYYQRAQLGAWPGGPAPYGFSLGRQPGPEGTRLPVLIPDDRAPVVVRIFEAYAQPEATLGSVARLLNGEGIPAPRRATWDNVALSRILHSPVYAMVDEDVCLFYQGKGLKVSSSPESFDGLHAGILVGKRDRSSGTYQDLREQHFSLANHLGLIPAGLWLRCQYKLESNRQLGGKGRGKHTWLSGLLKCAGCGYSVKVNRQGAKYYLVCSGRSNLGLCQETIRADLRGLEQAVARELERVLQACPDQQAESTTDGETSRALEEISRKADRLMAALAEGSALTISYINRAVERLEKERDGLIRQQALLASGPRGKVGRLNFGTLDLEGKKLVASLFIHEIRLGGDRAEGVWNV